MTLDPVTGKQVKLFNPRQDVWNDHFAMKDFFLVGLTPTGRGTIELLKMNLPIRVEVRQQVMQ